MALSAAALAALVTLAGCTASTSPSAESSKKPDAVPSTATGSLEELARRAECTPDVQTDARELRQANCSTPYGKYVLTTFATDRGQREWINGAKDYGGSYLVGRKWAAVGEPDVITALRGRLGGDVEAGEGHSGHHGS
ncbi:lipoprotein [Streptomyces coeruleoprunus]